MKTIELKEIELGASDPYETENYPDAGFYHNLSDGNIYCTMMEGYVAMLGMASSLPIGFNNVEPVSELLEDDEPIGDEKVSERFVLNLIKALRK